MTNTPETCESKAYVRSTVTTRSIYTPSTELHMIPVSTMKCRILCGHCQIISDDIEGGEDFTGTRPIVLDYLESNCHKKESGEITEAEPREWHMSSQGDMHGTYKS